MARIVHFGGVRFSSILVPVESSGDGLRGAQLASTIARRHGARLTLLPVNAKGEVAGGALVSSLERRLLDFAGPLRHAEALEVREAADDVSAAVRWLAASNAVDLIVLPPPALGTSNLEMDGVSVRVASEAPCPVLVVRGRAGAGLAAKGEFSHPLVAVSNQKLAARALDVTMALAKMGADIRLTHVVESAEVKIGSFPPGPFDRALANQSDTVRKQLKKLGKCLERAGFRSSVQVETGDPSGSVLCLVERNRNDLVVVLRKTPGGHRLLSSHVYRLLQRSPVPFLIVPQASRIARGQPRSTRGSTHLVQPAAND